MQKPTNISF